MNELWEEPVMQDTQDRGGLSPLNSDPQVRGSFHIADVIHLHDVTLRDGEQAPGVVFDRDDRLRIARALDALGVHRIEAGFPAISKEDQEGVTAIAGEGLEAEIWGFGRCLPGDVELNAACGVEQMILEISVSELKLAAYGLDRQKVLDRMLSALILAKDQGIKVAFMPVDLTRADLHFAEQVIIQAVEEGHADEIVVVDTIGVATPEAIFHLTRLIRQWVAVPLAIHCHNDFGLGLANSLAALKAGATCVHASVNCLGERAGNVDLAEVVMALQLLYSIDMGIRTELLTETARLVEALGGYPLSLTKPITGERIFIRESGGVVQQLLTLPAAVEPYPPEIVGLERGVVLGKKSGRFSIQHAVNRLGLEANDEEIARALVEVKERSNERHGLIDDDEFREILAQARSEPAGGRPIG
jgi:isopropylmalate/homocitrate/citramalate synthase